MDTQAHTHTHILHLYTHNQFKECAKGFIVIQMGMDAGWILYTFIVDIPSHWTNAMLV